MTLVLALHGVGGNGAGLLGLAPHLGVRMIAPNGPLTLHPGQHAWFDITGITAETRPARIRAARAALDALIAEAEAQDPRVVLLGFSQGAIMALDALARGRVAEIIAFNGRLAYDSTPAPRADARALVIGGALDRVIPASESTLAAERLNAQLLIEPGIGHEIGPQGLAAARTFLQ